MKAAVCYEYGKPLVVEDVHIAPPQQGEVKVRLAATAVCHSDIHIFKGDIPIPTPVIGGHESAGTVEETGEGVTKVKSGDNVIVSLLSPCGKCFYCTEGLPHLCEDMSRMMKPSPLQNQQGKSLGQGLAVGGFAEYVVVSESQIVSIPKEIPMDRASLLGCGVITGFGAVVYRAQVKPMSSVVVIGAGGVGLNSVQGAAFSGAFPLIAIDVSDQKLGDAKAFGATKLINAKKEEPVEAVKKLTHGRGADYVFVAVGSVDAVKQGIAMARKRGMIVLIGLPPAQQVLDFSVPEFISSEKVLTGGYMGSVNLDRDIPKLVNLYLEGKLKLDELITASYPLEEINKAIEAVERGEARRNVIIF